MIANQKKTEVFMKIKVKKHERKKEKGSVCVFYSLLLTRVSNRSYHYITLLLLFICIKIENHSKFSQRTEKMFFFCCILCIQKNYYYYLLKQWSSLFCIKLNRKTFIFYWDQISVFCLMFCVVFIVRFYQSSSNYR